MMKSTLLAGAAIAVALAFSPIKAYAIDVECLNCSTAAEQVLQFARQAEQLTQEINTATYTLNSWRTLVTENATLPAHLYQDIQGTIAQLENLRQQASLLQGNTGGLLANLGAATYPDYNMAQRVVVERNALANAMTQAGTALNNQQAVLGQQGAQLTTLESQSTSADGVKGAVQAGNGITATMAQQQSAYFSTSTAIGQASLTYQTQRLDREMASDQLTRDQMAGGLAAVCAAVGMGPLPLNLSSCRNVQATQTAAAQ